MGVLSILVDSVGLAVGSLAAAALSSCAAWWLADRFHRPRFAFLLLLALCIGLLLSPLEQSLFVRMASVFGLVATALLYFIVPEDDANGDEAPEPSSER